MTLLYLSVDKENNIPIPRHQYFYSTERYNIKSAMVIPSNYIDSTLIVTTKERLQSWAKEAIIIKKAIPSFKYIIIKDKVTFLDLCLKIINSDVNYDAVILPYKKFYGMTLPRGLNNEQLTTNIISLLGANHKWKRSIIDLSIVGKGLKPLSDITWYLTNKVYNTPVSSVQSFTEPRNMFGYLNDPISSNFIHTLTIHSSIKMDIPKIKGNIFWFDRTLYNMNREYKTKGDLLSYNKNIDIEKLEDKECCKCCIDIEEDIFFITDCCQTVICSACIFNKVTKRNIDKCPNCDKQLGDTGLLKLSNIDLESDTITLKEKKDPMISALIDIINGKVPDHDGYTETDFNKRNIIIGTQNIEPVSDKTIIFCHKELIKKIKKEINNNLITVLNTAENINLLEYTKIIFFNRIKDINHIIGKAQNLNRFFNLKIIELYYI